VISHVDIARIRADRFSFEEIAAAFRAVLADMLTRGADPPPGRKPPN
jgi:hypothetical protein